MASAIIFEDQITVPLNIHSLADFRRWAVSDEFPEQGRIDYIGGTIEVDMVAGQVIRQGGLKGEIHGVLFQLVKQGDLGYLRIDRSRVSSPEADLSAEPDIIFVSHDSLAAGRARVIPRETAGDRPMEIEGAADLTVSGPSAAAFPR